MYNIHLGMYHKLWNYSHESNLYIVRLHVQCTYWMLNVNLS